MNRKILFRGKRLDTGTWIESDIMFATNDGEENRGFVVTGFDYNGINEPYNFYILEIDPATISQFTGLTDKNGKRIFEGDVVLLEDNAYSSGKKLIATGFVGFNDASFTVEQIKGIEASYGDSFYGPDGREFEWSELEIIGNIFDNPELAVKHD